MVYSGEEETGLGVEGECRRIARKVDKGVDKMKCSPYKCCHNIHGGGSPHGEGSDTFDSQLFSPL